MKVLLACEESQAVTKEMRKLGHEAYSCDILPCSGKRDSWHIQGDVLPLLSKPWDLVIGFPPCTHLASSGARWFEQKQRDGRQQAAAAFFLAITKANSPRIAVENPVGIMSTLYRKPDQIIQPWQFGDSFQKSTCLWLKNLPKLQPTEIVSPGEFKEFTTSKGQKKRQPLWYFEALKLTPIERSKARSKTFPGIAKAMAEQWTK